MRLFLALLITLFSTQVFAAGKDCMNDKNYPDMSKTTLEKVLSEKTATVVDVNSKESFAKSRVPGAVHYGTHKKDLAKVLPKDKKAMIVAYCGGKSCTAWKRAARAACKMGYTNIHHFSEGLRGWNKNKRG